MRFHISIFELAGNHILDCSISNELPTHNELGGDVSVETGTRHGFMVHGWLPTEAGGGGK